MTSSLLASSVSRGVGGSGKGDGGMGAPPGLGVEPSGVTSAGAGQPGSGREGVAGVSRCRAALRPWRPGPGLTWEWHGAMAAKQDGAQ